VVEVWCRVAVLRRAHRAGHAEREDGDCRRLVGVSSPTMTRRSRPRRRSQGKYAGQRDGLGVASQFEQVVSMGGRRALGGWCEAGAEGAALQGGGGPRLLWRARLNPSKGSGTSARGRGPCRPDQRPENCVAREPLHPQPAAPCRGGVVHRWAEQQVLAHCPDNRALDSRLRPAGCGLRCRYRAPDGIHGKGEPVTLPGMDVLSMTRSHD
jgi:hypothetical protein